MTYDKKASGAAYYQLHKDGWNDNRAPRHREIDRASERDYHLRHHYGITTTQYDEILASQNGRCASCGTDTPGGKRNVHFHVDHDHDTGAVRGLLCQNCNIALGHLKDNVDIVMALAAYLIQHENLLVITKDVL